MSRDLSGPPQWPAQQHPYKRMRLGGKIVIVDALLAEVVRALNRCGAKTDFCCQGNHTAHEDRKYGKSSAYISVSRKSQLPDSLIALAKRRGFQSYSKYDLYATPPAVDLPATQLRANNRYFVQMLREWAESQ